MKVLVKLLFFSGILPFVGCSQLPDKESKLQFSEVSFFEKPEYGNFTDGVRVIHSEKKDYFFISIEKPECCQRGASSIRLNYEQFVSDSLIESKQTFIKIDSSFTPVYQTNTLEAFSSDDEIGMFFFCIMESPFGGLDPKELVLWGYYKGVTYKFSGEIPVHSDWDWDSTYTFAPDKELKEKYPKVYARLLDAWNQNIERYKEHYNFY